MVGSECENYARIRDQRRAIQARREESWLMAAKVSSAEAGAAWPPGLEQRIVAWLAGGETNELAPLLVSLWPGRIVAETVGAMGLGSSHKRNPVKDKTIKACDSLAVDLRDSDMPLGELDEEHQRRLCKVLWSWTFCAGCEAGAQCEAGACPSDRLRHLKAFWSHCDNIVATYDAVESVGRRAALRSMEELLGAAEKVMSSANDKRRDALLKVFAAPQAVKAQVTAQVTTDGSSSNASQDAARPPIRSRATDENPERKEVALNMLVEMVLLINCGGQQHSLSALERGQYSLPWSKELSLASFLDQAFPRTEDQTDRKINNSDDFEGPITAHVLRKEAKVRLQPTSNLRNHLKLDRKTRVLEVFHHVAFLKEQLRLSKDMAADCSTADSIKSGALPRQLVLETLNTLQKVLFPQDDPKSRWLLRSLCSSYDFDKDCLRFEWTAIRNKTEKEIPYTYWLERLEILRDEVENPRPQGFLELWLERRSAPRYVMLATLVGVIIAILLGAAALAVSGYQTYIAYNAWKYPVAPPGG